MIRIGVDIGGTFTDLVLWRGDGDGLHRLFRYKVSSTPPDFAEGVKLGLDHLLKAADIDPGEPIILVHGMTVGTNAVVERSGGPVALLVSEGFRDILEIGRMRLPKLLDFFSFRPAPLIPRELVFEVRERLRADGGVNVALDQASVLDGARRAREMGIRTLALCFLHAHVNPEHERAAMRAIKQAYPDMDVVASSAVSSQEAEYERAMLAVLNCYVKPTMASYLADLESHIADRLPSAQLFIASSNGGVMGAEEARSFPVHTLLSGPAAGVTAARFVGDLLGAPDLLTMDMGGTSTDMSLIHRGRPMTSTQAQIGDFPLTLPVTSIEAIGAGGGSIAWLDGGVLRVGPQSASAMPGPACYGRGGTQPTLSDAYLLCGYFGDSLLGGRLRLDRAKAEAAFAPLAAALRMTVPEVAESCITVATATMLAKALPFLARTGIGAEALTLLTFGGAGAIHGPLLAQELGIERIVVPPQASVFCALGCMVADIVRDVVRTVHGPLDLGRTFDGLQAEAEAWLAGQMDSDLVVGTRIECYASARYQGQSFQIEVPVDPEAREDKVRLIERFHGEHQVLYGHCEPEAPVEIKELRLRIVGALPAPAAGGAGSRAGLDRTRPAGHREILVGSGRGVRASLFLREALAAGETIAGPALIEQVDTTILVPAGFTATVGNAGELMLARVRSEAADSTWRFRPDSEDRPACPLVSQQ